MSEKVGSKQNIADVFKKMYGEIESHIENLSSLNIDRIKSLLYHDNSHYKNPIFSQVSVHS